MRCLTLSWMSSLMMVMEMMRYLLMMRWRHQTTSPDQVSSLLLLHTPYRFSSITVLHQTGFPPSLFYTEQVFFFKMHLTLVWVPLYSLTETRWNHIDAEAYFLKVKHDLSNQYLMPFENSTKLNFWLKIVKV